MKIVTLNLQTTHELDFQNKDIVHIIENEDLRKVWETMLQTIKLESKTGFKLEDEVMVDVRNVIEQYQKERLSEEIELEGKFTYIYVNQQQNVYIFSSYYKAFKIEIEVKDLTLIQENGTIKTYKSKI